MTIADNEILEDSTEEEGEEFGPARRIRTASSLEGEVESDKEAEQEE